MNREMMEVLMSDNPDLDGIRLQCMRQTLNTKVRLSGLTSTAGQRLNGTCGIVTGMDTSEEVPAIDRRMWFTPLTGGAAIRVKPENLVPASIPAYTRPPPQPMQPDKVIRLWQEAIDICRREHGDATDGWDHVRPRLKFLEEHLSRNELPPVSKCMDQMVPRSEWTQHMALMHVEPIACLGDGSVDFTNFNEFLVGNGDDCAVCGQAMGPESVCSSLPCGHGFHRACGSEWLRGGDLRCPLCQAVAANATKHPMFVLMDNPTFVDKQVVRRLKEWLLTGMCQRCQNHRFEREI